MFRYSCGVNLVAGLDNLRTRIGYLGGARQVDRMVEDKLRSLKKALLYSYQSATAVLEDGREFRCLINPDKFNMEADDKILSIPFEDICLNKAKPDEATTSSGLEPTGIKCGSVIQWKENGTYWIVYSQLLQEIAYFRGYMRQCAPEPIEIGGKQFWYYLKGPDEKGIDWQKTKNFIFNELNYSLEIYISNTTETNEFFQRFKKCKIQGKPFEVQAVDRWSTNGILVVYLKEDYSNKWDSAPEVSPAPPEVIDPNAAKIEGPARLYPYDIAEYKIQGYTQGLWMVDSKRARITTQDATHALVEVVSGKSGNFTLIYHSEGQPDITLPITIESL